MGGLPDTVTWHGGAVRLIDQTRLPGELVLLDCTSVEQLAEAIEQLRVRGAPAIGVAAGYGLALAAYVSAASTLAGLRADLAAARDRLARTRPTAVNLFWALDRQMALAERFRGGPDALRTALLEQARQIHADDVRSCRTLGAHGAAVLPFGVRILTHCNAGALATAGYGTALGVVRAAAEAGKLRMVWVDETRPLLQGARLTAWELLADGLPATVLCDNMAASLMADGQVDCVVTGADRIAANGDTANKIGTYGLAVLAKHHGLPFYVAAPLSTVDLAAPDGRAIPIERRHDDEVRGFGGTRTTPDGVLIHNPAFDVTPGELIAGIITERGVLRPPYRESLAAALASVTDP